MTEEVSSDGLMARYRLDGRVAIVTGASSGLGARFSKVLHAAGASVVMMARRRDRLEGIAARLENSAIVSGDVTNSDDLDAVVREAVETFGSIDVLINNAGYSDPVSALLEDKARFETTLSVNLVAPFCLSQRVAAHMIETGSGGAIVNVASVLGLGGTPKVPQGSYAASKGGLINLTRELAEQWAREDVRVNALAPGWFESEMTREMFETERGQRYIERRAPMARAGRYDELDGALLFLASDASTYMTGQALVVDGGWSAV